jgi:hypothetical protein
VVGSLFPRRGIINVRVTPIQIVRSHMKIRWMKYARVIPPIDPLQKNPLQDKCAWRKEFFNILPGDAHREGATRIS